MSTVAFFNNKGGVGKTSLVFHLSWMFKELGLRVVAADLDPQANLTSMFLNEDRLEGLWQDQKVHTIFDAVWPLIRGIGDIEEAHIEEIYDDIGLLPGDLSLSGIEDELSLEWPRSLDGQERSFRVLTIFSRVIQEATQRFGADVTLIDVGPNLGAINRMALIASDYVVLPLGPDLFSLRGLKNVGPALRDWRKQWQQRLEHVPKELDIPMPSGKMWPIGYVLMRQSVRSDRPVKAYHHKSPQANLTSMFLNEDRLEGLWQDQKVHTIFDAVWPLIRGIGDIEEAHIEEIYDDIGLLPGDLSLSGIEDELSLEWPRSLDGQERSFRVLTIFSRVIQEATQRFGADVTLIDVGPNLGAINRMALIASDYVVLPLGPDLFSLRGLKNVGPALRDWRKQWQQRLEHVPKELDIPMPSGKMWPIGYVLMRQSVRSDRPVKAYQKWISRMPNQFHSSVLNQSGVSDWTIENDENCLAQLKDYRSLMPLAQETQKPMFLLRPGDGAFGGHQTAVQSCYRDFRALARTIAHRSGTTIEQIRALL